MRKMLCLMLASLMCLSVVGCNSEQSNEGISSESDNNMPVVDSTTEYVQEEISSESSLEKMEKYLGSWIEFKEYGYDDSIANRKSFSHAYIDVSVDLDSYITLDDGTVINLFSSSIYDIIAQGYVVESVEEPTDDLAIRKDVVLCKDNMSLITLVRTDELDINSAIIRGVVLEADDDSINFNYNGLDKDLIIDSVMSKLGEPDYIYIGCDEKGEDCWITLDYSGDTYAGFTFTYDVESDTTTFDNIYINT